MQYSPRITPNEFQYVHHMLIYLCESFNETEVGRSAPCFGMTGSSVSECRQGSLIAGWAVGGTVSTCLNISLLLQFSIHCLQACQGRTNY